MILRLWRLLRVRPDFLALAIVGLAHLSVCIRFLGQDLLRSAWDLPGHLEMARVYRDQLWPWLSGWDPRSFGGYPVGYFYPPLLEWCAGGLGRLFPLEAVFQGLVAASFLASPLAVFAYLSRLRLSPNVRASAIYGIFTSIFLLAYPTSMGGTAIGTFRGGLVSAQWGWTLFFLYLSELECLDSGTPFRERLRPGLVLGLLVLSHGAAAIAALIASVAHAVRGGRAGGRALAIPLAAGLALAAGWLGPYLRGHADLATGMAIPLPDLRDAFPALPFFAWGLIALAAASAVRQLWRLRGLEGSPEWLGLFLGLSLLAAVAGTDSRGGQPWHVYRLLPFFFAFSAITAARLFTRGWGTGALALLFVYSAAVAPSQIFLPRPAELSVDLPSGFETQRGLVLQGFRSPLTGRYEDPYGVATALQSRGIALLNGVFVESSTVAPFANAFMRELTAEIVGTQMERAPMVAGRLREHAESLGVQWILSDQPLRNEELDQLPVVGHHAVPDTYRVGNEMQREDFHLYALENPLARLLDSPPPLRVNEGGGEWRRPLYADWEQPPPSRASSPIALNGTSEGYRLGLGPVPGWVAISLPYFPNWRARSADGAEIPLLRGSASMLSLFGAGEISVRFERSEFERWAQGVSLLALAAAGVALFAGRRGRRRPDVAPLSR